MSLLACCQQIYFRTLTNEGKPPVILLPAGVETAKTILFTGDVGTYVFFELNVMFSENNVKRQVY